MSNNLTWKPKNMTLTPMTFRPLRYSKLVGFLKPSDILNKFISLSWLYLDLTNIMIWPISWPGWCPDLLDTPNSLIFWPYWYSYFPIILTSLISFPPWYFVITDIVTSPIFWPHLYFVIIDILTSMIFWIHWYSNLTDILTSPIFWSHWFPDPPA